MANPYHHRPVPDYLIASPLVALLYPFHQLLLRLRGSPRLPPPDARPIRVVCISDTHTLKWPDVPDGDLLIHAGDLANDGSVREIQSAVDWLRSLPHRHKVVICGNHDSYFDARSRCEEDREDHGTSSSFAAVSASTASIHSLDEITAASRIDWGDIHYLQHSSVTLSFPGSPAASPTTPLTSTHPRSLTIYGAPQIPALMPFGPEHAFTYPPHHDAWSRTVPPDTDILITHTPPEAHLDMSPIYSTGCPNLLAEAWRVRPALHVFGHIHNSAGREPIFWDEAQRAWERLCASRRPRAKHGRLVSLAGFLRDLFDPSSWLDAARVIFYGMLGVVWSQVWGGEACGGGWMVNAACMYRSSGRLANPPQVIEL
ncbi:hypothetical protein N7462_001287 [Penicillium macrosclerotiorum]|uniref:uncharacterized protein n=1 Tax=Penicillium macrosclerotiorum TaxID=303699 RepID=UPI0025470047|nr:uncharacterized protein N7462_001287 [Penicillium macrosclerotiorum]KAJ5691864.1 hypothetical protein N7462_001287 [Penicillium macrosclerotiorum]